MPNDCSSEGLRFICASKVMRCSIHVQYMHSLLALVNYTVLIDKCLQIYRLAGNQTGNHDISARYAGVKTVTHSLVFPRVPKTSRMAENAQAQFLRTRRASVNPPDGTAAGPEAPVSNPASRPSRSGTHCRRAMSDSGKEERGWDAFTICDGERVLIGSSARHGISHAGSQINLL